MCAEELVRLYNLSEQTYSIAPEGTILRVRKSDGFDYIELRLKDERHGELEARMFRDAKARRAVLGDHPLTNIEMHNRHLSDALRTGIGVDYQHAVQTLGALLDGIRSEPGGFDVPFCNRDVAVSALAKSLGLEPKAVTATIAGFAVTRADMLAEGRKIWKPKQEYRAMRRGLFEMPHATGTHLTWSREMAKESLVAVINGVVAKRIPSEWLSPQVEAALESLVQEASRWFETRASQALATVGVVGRSFKTTIGQGPDRLDIPPDIGEIDILGYSEPLGLIVLGECKLVRPSTEPAFFRDDLSKFVEGSKSYAQQVLRKRKWVHANSDAVKRAVSSIPGWSPALATRGLATVCITFFPSIADYFMPDCRCVALTELVADLKEATAWPYSVGLDSF